ncbi:prolyl oligopeptidase family serine peptidase [Bacillus sp. 1P06AnD]|uniref:prolyl oligopeptidase family serine peptidase n=1 Tax=Bacillus sp. 1P06AnD TaxID=3132208 RepID=UPI0039A3807A
MVIIKKDSIHNIPVLHVVKQQLADQPAPLVIFLHGVNSIKERNLQFAYMLAEKGYRIILPDALYHGERAEEKNIYASFWKIVLNSIEELVFIKDSLVSDGLVLDGRIGLIGTSMGAITTLGAMGKYEWIHAGVSLMGNPAYIEFANQQVEAMKNMKADLLTEEQIEQQLAILEPYDVTKRLAEWKERPLMFWHGGNDKVVPYQAEYAFYEKIKPSYDQKNIPISYILDEKAGHAVPNAGVVEAVNWFVEYL